MAVVGADSSGTIGSVEARVALADSFEAGTVTATLLRARGLVTRDTLPPRRTFALAVLAYSFNASENTYFLCAIDGAPSRGALARAGTRVARTVTTAVAGALLVLAVVTGPARLAEALAIDTRTLVASRATRLGIARLASPAVLAGAFSVETDAISGAVAGAGTPGTVRVGPTGHAVTDSGDQAPAVSRTFVLALSQTTISALESRIALADPIDTHTVAAACVTTALPVTSLPIVLSSTNTLSAGAVASAVAGAVLWAFPILALVARIAGVAAADVSLGGWINLALSLEATIIRASWLGAIFADPLIRAATLAVNAISVSVAVVILSGTLHLRTLSSHPAGMADALA